MLKYEIHYELPNGEEDYIIITGETVEDIRDAADERLAAVGGQNPWSRRIGPANSAP